MPAPTTRPARTVLLESGACLAGVASALALVFAPAPPDAWDSIAVGCFGLSVAAALWSVASRRMRRALAGVAAIAAVHEGFSFDTRVSQISAAVLILAVVAFGLGRRTS